MFVIFVITDITTVSSFDLMQICQQQNLRTQNVSLSQQNVRQKHIPNIGITTSYHLRHVIRI